MVPKPIASEAYETWKRITKSSGLTRGQACSDLTLKATKQVDREYGEVGVRRHSGARHYHGIHRVPSAPLADGAGADGTVAQRDVRAIAESDIPAVPFGTGAAHAEIAAEIAD